VKPKGKGQNEGKRRLINDKGIMGKVANKHVGA